MAPQYLESKREAVWKTLRNEARLPQFLGGLFAYGMDGVFPLVTFWVGFFQAMDDGSGS